MSVAFENNRYVIDEPEKGKFLVHQAVYTDQQLFDLEMEKIFESNWLYLAHEQQIKNPHDYLTLYMGRQPVILSRDEKGQLHCLLNRCAHRGARLCRSESGNSSRFRCLYHGWSYKNDGSLVGVADKVAYPPDFDVSDSGLFRVPHLAVYNGFIFASLNPDVPSLEEHLGNAKAYLDLLVNKYPSGIEISKGVSKYGYQGNWKLQYENVLDYYHLPFVHKSFFEAKGKKISPHFQDTREDLAIYLGNGHGVTIALDNKTDIIEEPGELEQRMGKMESKWAQKARMHLNIFPNLMLLEGPGLQIRVLRPMAVNQTEVKGYSFYPVGMTEANREKKLRGYEEFFGPAGMGTPDDIEVFKACTEGYQAKAFPWNNLSRGMHREIKEHEISELGPFEAAGNITDDTIYRGIFRWWAQAIGGHELQKAFNVAAPN